ncbi:39S ribosomal protein L44, mitochondrial [Halotydeus destructor]|nr:39S ribosomal protein L44, mitochondrial [Halotydeus destructor]
MHANTVKTLQLMYQRARDHNAMNLQPLKRSEYLEWNLKAELFGFVQRIQERMSEKGVRVAFTDSSYVNEQLKMRSEAGVEGDVQLEHNSEIAAYGESLMIPFIKSYLRAFLPRLPEEGIRAITEFIVSDGVLADISKWLGTNDIILTSDYSPSTETLAKVVKAVVGTIANENGNEQAHKFITDLIMPYIQDQPILELWNIEFPREVLRTILKNDQLPVYEPRLIRETGRNTIFPCFGIGLYVNKELIGSGAGETLEIAEEMAAYNALERLFGIRPNDFVLKFGPKVHSLKYSEAENAPISDWSTRLFDTKKYLSSSRA